MMHLPLVGSRPACLALPELSQTMPSHFCTHTPLPASAGTSWHSHPAMLRLTAHRAQWWPRTQTPGTLCWHSLAITLLDTARHCSSAEWHQHITSLVEADNALDQWWPRTQTPGTLCCCTPAITLLHTDAGLAGASARLAQSPVTLLDTTRARRLARWQLGALALPAAWGRTCQSTLLRHFTEHRRCSASHSSPVQG